VTNLSFLFSSCLWLIAEARLFCDCSINDRPFA